MKKFISVLLVIAMLVPMLCVDVFAAEHPVNDFAGLKQAIADANDGDVITVASNIILDETLAIENKNITIKGTSVLAILARNALTNNDIKNTMFVIKNSKVKFDGLNLGGNKMNRIIYSEESEIELNKASINDGCPGDNSNINPGGGVFLRGGSLTATDTVFIGNTPGTNPNLPAGDGDKNGGAIYTGQTSANITITGGSFVDNEVKAYGHGAAIYQENGVLNVTGTSFKNNKGNLGGGNEGTQGACIHTRDKVTATISGVTAEIAKGFNTGGFLRSWKSNVTVIGSTFTIADLGDGYGYSGGALCFEGGTSKVTGSTFTCTGSKLFHAGGFIDIVGTGTHTIDGNTMTGSGNDNNSAIASFGGAISVEQGATATVTIKDNTITNSTASDNGGVIAIGTYVETKIPKTKPSEPPIPKETPSIVTMSGNKISDSGLIMWKGGAGGALFVGKGSTVTVSGDQIKDTKAPYGGGIYNEGNIYISGGASLTGGIALSLGGEIYNNCELTVDDATITGNFVGPANWNQTPGHNKASEYGGTNIYAEKDVTITPNATITTGKDVRVLDGQSAILLTDKLTNQIDVSISETTGGNEKATRKVGYVAARGVNDKDIEKVSKVEFSIKQRVEELDKTIKQIEDAVAKLEAVDEEHKDKEKIKNLNELKTFYAGHKELLNNQVKNLSKFKTPYIVNSKDEKEKDEEKIHYISKDTSQAIAEFADHTSPGKWDFVLNPETKEIVLGQRVKLVYHGNLGKVPVPVINEQGAITGTEEKDSTSKPVNVYKTGKFWEKQLEDFRVADAKRDKWSFMGWYHWIDDANEAAENNTDSIQKLKNPSLISDKLFDFSRVKFSNNNTDEIVNILTPNVINTYSGWSENIDIEVVKDWKKADGKEALDDKDKAEVKITLKGGEEDEALTLNSANEFKGKFENLSVFTKSYNPDEKINMNLKFTPKEYKVEEEKLEGFNTSYKPEKIIANSDGAKKITITNKKEELKNYKVTYEFKSEEPDKSLPKAVNDKKPTNQTDVADGTKITPEIFEDVIDGEDTWKFKGWAPTEQTINKADIHFVGTWALSAKPQPKTGNVYVKYIAEDGTVLEAETAVKSNAPIGTDYKTVQKEFDNCEFLKMGQGSAAASGKVVEGDLHVIYVYKKIKPTPEPKSDFSIEKSVDKATYEKAGEVLTYTVTVKNTGEKKLENLSISDTKVNLNEDPFTLDVNASKTFTYTYIVTADDVRAREVINTASVKIGEDGKPKTATAKSILKTKRGDVYVRYETEDGKILDEFAVELDAAIGTYYYTEEKAFPGYRYIGLAPYSDPAEGTVINGTLYVVYLYRAERPSRTPDRRRDRRYEEVEEVEPITEAKRKPELNKKDHKQYMYGYPDWTFVPEANITRGEAAAMFARLFKEYPGLDYDFKKYYTDVERTYWGFKEISYLSEFGILSGYSDGTFRPNNKITRAEFVKIVESFETLSSGINPYTDLSGSHWALRYILSSATKGWISGYPDGTFRPDSYITRAEAVTIVNKLLDRTPDKDYITKNKPQLKPFKDLKPSYWAYYEIYEAVEGHFYNRSFRDADEHWWRLTDERFVFSQPRYNY